MIRALLGFIVIAALIVAAVFFADHPGQVEIVWRGWLLQTSVGVLAAVATLAGLAAALLVWLAWRILDSPRAFLRHRRERRRRAGYRALTQGMVAVAAGDPREAQRFARKADALLADPPLTLLLSAQAAQLEGDETAAAKFFTAMLDRRETEFLGLRGLLNQALRSGDRGAALRLTRRAATLRPGAPWVIESRFGLEVRGGRWAAAEETLARAVKYRIIPPERARHHRGVILHELSFAAMANGDRRRGINLAGQARALAPDLATPAAHYARQLLENGRPAPAAKALEVAWRTAPHPELAQVYRAIKDGEDPLARVKRFERLTAQNPNVRETYLTLAEAALAAQLWGETRRYLEQALTAPAPPIIARPGNSSSPSAAPNGNSHWAGPTGATPRLCVLMARLEEEENASTGGMREWLDRAVTAMPDPRYVCLSCGGESLEWRSLCPHCASFDSLAWRTPASAASGMTLPIAVQNDGSR